MVGSVLDSLFPRPRHIEVIGGTASLEPVTRIADDSVPTQGFEVRIDEAGATVRVGDEAGARYAQQVLDQLAQVEGDLPGVRIRDWPDIANRGFMLDTSRDRVPTMETLAWLVERVALLRINHFELYTEHTFAYKDHEIVWRDASPLTPIDLRQLDKLCAQHGIELVANQNTFAHMGRWLKHDPYRTWAECPDAAAPDCLAPSEANATFALELLNELTEAITSTTVNVGGDEPFELGQGVSAQEVKERGAHAVYLDHLRRILDPLIEQGRQVLFWGDVLRSDPEVVAKLPSSGATAVAWNYEAEASFDEHARSYAETGYPFWVAPGTSSWNSLFGRWSNAKANLVDAATAATDAGADGILIADWGDNGHLQPLAVSLAPLIFGAGVAWCADSNANVDPGALTSKFLGDKSGRLGPCLIELGELATMTGIEVSNGSPVFTALVRDEQLVPSGTFDSAGWADSMELVDTALHEFDSNPVGGVRGSIVAAELVACARLARHGLWRLGMDNGKTVRRPDELAEDMVECLALQRRAWLGSSRPGGLEDSLARLQRW